MAINIPKDERALLGRLATRFGARSVGGFVKELIALGLEAKCKLSAAELRKIRRQYYAAAFLVIFTCALAINWRDPEGNQRGCRRCARRPGLRFEECVTVETEEA